MGADLAPRPLRRLDPPDHRTTAPRIERVSASPTNRTWILTGSLENFRINVERGFDVIGFKERRRRQAEEFEPGDQVVFYVTGVQAFGAIARVRSHMFEDRAPIWPPGKKDEPYPWRVEAEPVVVLAEDDFVAAEELAGVLEHVRKWPPEHWHLAFQGQLRPVGEADAGVLRERIDAATVAA
jgi:EVE domain-containing protein